MNDFTAARERMVQDQLARRDISSKAVLDAMRAVPREYFVPDRLSAQAYDDCPLPIGEDQTISQPYIVALTIQAADIGIGDRVLEIGAGSGYAAAVLGRIAARVFGIERHASLADGASGRIVALGYDNVSIRQGDGSRGLPQEAPFDAIIVSAGGKDIPPALTDQLSDGGRLVIPVGPRHGTQTLVKLTRRGAEFERKELGDVRFVPLVEG